MAIALRAMRASGELTAAQALGRLRREAPAAVHTAAVAVALTAVAILVAFGAGDRSGPTSCSRCWGWGSRSPRAPRWARWCSRPGRATGSGSRCSAAARSARCGRSRR